MNEVHDSSIYESSAAVGGGDGIEAVHFGGGEGGKPVPVGGDGSEIVNWKHNMVEFGKGLAEMSVELGKGCRDVVMQSVLREDSYVVRKFRGPCKTVCAKLRFMNEYLPEDRDPIHSWSVIVLVSIIAFAVLYVHSEHHTITPLINKLRIHPPNATRVLLPDGRHLAYQEQGVSAERARFSVIIPHSFLSSRLAGIPGVKISLLQEFGIRLVAYDLPGFGESDPHPTRNLETSAMDMLHLSYAIGVLDKFWVMGYSGGSLHAWAALRYIPDRLAGAIMVAPMVNPYEPTMSRGERRRTWENWTKKRKLMYFLGRRLRGFLPFFYRRSFLSGEFGPIDKWLSMSLGTRDRALIEEEMFQEFWQRDVEESVRQGNVKPFVEEAVLQVSNWGFSLAELKIKKKPRGKGMISWLKSLYNQAEDITGFLGPVHVWQAMEDRVVPPSMCDYVQRVLPGAMVHKLLYEGHFTYFYFCDECHRQMFGTVFGEPKGPIDNDQIQPFVEEKEEIAGEEVTAGDLPNGNNVSDFTTNEQ